MIYRGWRARYGNEACPTCTDPGSGMVLEIPDDSPGLPGSRWICSRCMNKSKCDEDRREVTMSSDRPTAKHFAHDCEKCVFLGTWKRGDEGPIECYWCAKPGLPNLASVLGRYGSKPEEYMSSHPPEAFAGGRDYLAFADAWYLFALIRAHELGLYKL